MSVADKINFLRYIGSKVENYETIRAGKINLNLPVEQIDKTEHTAVKEYFLNSKNNFSSKPFGTGTNFYLDFNIDKVDYTFHQFLLKFTLTNNGSTALNTLLSPLIVERVQILKDGNIFSSYDTTDWDLLFSNLNKINHEYNTNDYSILNVGFDSNNRLTSNSIPANSSSTVQIELPIPLARSKLHSLSIKNFIVIRVYFKSAISVSGPVDSLIGLSNVSLVLRVKELTEKAKLNLVKQPKITHMFMKKVINKYSIQQLNAGQNYKINLQGFNNIASLALIYLTYPQYNVASSSTENNIWYNLPFRISNVYITDGSGLNINNNIKYDVNYNKYLLEDYFKKFNLSLRQLSKTGNYDGQLFVLPFCGNDKDVYNSPFLGGYNFKNENDYILNFQSLDGSSTSVEVYILWFIPSIVDLCYGNIDEHIA